MSALQSSKVILTTHIKVAVYTYIYGYQQFNLDPVHAYPHIFENRDCFLRFQKLRELNCPHEIAKTMEIR